jgi:predicted membrane chloride channel (bestrophin family)
MLRSAVAPAARTKSILKLSMDAVAAAPAKNAGLGKGYVSPLVPLASFDSWNKQLPAYPHIPPAPRYSSNDWIQNIVNIFQSHILRRVASHLVANVFFAILVYSLYVQVPALVACAKLLSPTAHSLTGAALGLLLVFRTNSAYARVYDARCIWGQLTNTIREMARLAHTNMQGLDREHALMLTGALPSLMLNHLQSQDSVYRNTQWSAAQKGVLTDLLSEHDFKCIWAARNRPMCAAKMIGAVYRSWFSNVDALKKHFGVKDGRAMTPEECSVMAANIQAAKLHMERQLEIISNCYGASERIVRSNVPAAYSRHTSRFLSMWCFTLPFVLVHSLQWLMIPTVALICWSLFVIEEVGHCVEDPFNVHMYIGGSGQEDVLIIEGSQANLREDSLDRNPGPATRVNSVPRYPGDELEYDVTEWHDEWKKATEANRAATIGA